ncbi:unnamed protein product [Diamesa serratosioi]
MKTITGFCDFCVPWNEENQDEVLDILNNLIHLGYQNVAIEQTIYHEKLITGKNKDPIPEPINLDELITKTKRKLRLFNRLTIAYSDPSISFITAKSLNYKKYHLVAALPLTDAALQHSCQSFQGDIITYNANTIKFRLSRKIYYVAIKRNMFFEIKYAPVILNSLERRATITRSQQYHMVGKSKSIIISSEAKNKFQLRGVYDIANLGLIFGMSEEQAKSSISSLCKKLILSADCRILGRTPVLLRFEDVSTSESSEDGSDEDEKKDTTNSTNKRSKSVEKNAENPSKKAKSS